MDARGAAKSRQVLCVDWSRARSRCFMEAKRLLGSEHDAEEAVQEALMRAWRMQDSCRNRHMPLPWLLRITRNEAFRIMDRRRIRGEVLCEEIVHGGGEPSGVDFVVERLAVRQAVEALPLRDQQLIELRYVRDLTQPRVAEVAGLPEGTVKVRLHRARNRLRVALGVAE